MIRFRKAVRIVFALFLASVGSAALAQGLPDSGDGNGNGNEENVDVSRFEAKVEKVSHSETVDGKIVVVIDIRIVDTVTGEETAVASTVVTFDKSDIQLPP